MSHQIDQTQQRAAQTEPQWGLWAAGVLALSAILYFTRLGTRALWSSEFRWGEISREMLKTGNYFWPTIDGIVYFDKPLGTYWLIVLSTPFTGGMNETAARLPCAIAGLLGVAFLMILARRLYDSRTAVWAGFILATSFSFVFFSRHASADVETVTGELAALLLFLRNEDRGGGWWVVGLWLIMAVTSLMKGLLGFALPIVMIGTYSCLRDGWAELERQTLHGPIAGRIGWLIERNRWFFNWYSVVAIAVGLAAYVAPFQISQHVTNSGKGLQMAFHESVTRFFKPWDHRGPIYLYLYVIFALMAPWSVLLPAALVETHHLRDTDVEPARSDRFALVYFWATFVFFTLSRSRRSYYILPILPAAAILVARTLAQSGAIQSRLARKLLLGGYALLALATACAIVMLVPASAIVRGAYALLPPLPYEGAFIVFWVVSVAGIAYAIRQLSPHRIGVSVGLIASFSMVYIYIFAMPAAEAYRGEKDFALAALQKLNGDTGTLGFFKTVGPLFYMDPPKPIPKFDTTDDLAAAVRGGSVKWLIVRRRDLPLLGSPAILTAEASYPWETDENYRNKVVLVRMESAPSPK